MSNSRPRPSVLNLFDPLANSSETPATPRRDASPPANLTLTSFFNRTYKPKLDSPPVPLKRRLIDIGDMTLEDAASPETLLDQSLDDGFSATFSQAEEEEENATLTFRDMVKAATPNKVAKSTPDFPPIKAPPTPQTPHVDITVEDTTPVSQLAQPNNLTPPELSPKGAAPTVLVERTPKDSSQDHAQKKQKKQIQVAWQEAHLEPANIHLPPSPLISSQELPINDSRSSLAEASSICNLPHASDDSPTTGSANEPKSPQPSTASCHLGDPTDPSLANPQVHIVLSQTSESATPAFLEPETTKGTSTGATLRPNPPNTSSQDLQRASIDLHASFQMYLQSEDMSFDLLSDKVSLFNPQHGMVSFLSAVEDDTSFNIETERANMEEALKACSEDKSRVPKADDSPSTSASSSAPVTPIDVPSTPTTPAQQPFDPPIVTGSNLKTIRKRLSIPIPISSPRLIGHPSPLTGTKSPLQLGPLLPSEGGTLKRSPSSKSTLPSASLIAKRRTSLPLATPPKLPKDQNVHLVPPLAVPALKIVKRPRARGHEGTNPTSSTSGALEPRNISAAPLAKIYELPTIVPLNTRRPVKEQEPLRASNEMEPRIARGLAESTRPLIPPRPPVPIEPAETAGQGPRRVPISEGPRLKPAAIPRAVTLSMPLSGGPRRVPHPAPIASALPTPQTRPAIGGPSGLRAPTQSSAAVLNVGSSLPKPTSRTSAMASRLPALKALKSGGLASLRRAT